MIPVLVHFVALEVVRGQRGELRQRRYRAGQEDQLGSLGLVTNVIILWNTIYTDMILDQLRQEGYPVNDQDVAHLSPLIHAHLHTLGRYSFALPDDVARGEFRQLRDPKLDP